MGSGGIIDPMNLSYMKFLAQHTLKQALQGAKYAKDIIDKPFVTTVGYFRTKFSIIYHFISRSTGIIDPGLDFIVGFTWIIDPGLDFTVGSTWII